MRKRMIGRYGNSSLGTRLAVYLTVTSSRNLHDLRFETGNLDDLNPGILEQQFARVLADEGVGFHDADVHSPDGAGETQHSLDAREVSTQAFRARFDGGVENQLRRQDVFELFLGDLVLFCEFEKATLLGVCVPRQFQRVAGGENLIAQLVDEDRSHAKIGGLRGGFPGEIQRQSHVRRVVVWLNGG